MIKFFLFIAATLNLSIIDKVWCFLESTVTRESVGMRLTNITIFRVKLFNIHIFVVV